MTKLIFWSFNTNTTTTTPTPTPTTNNNKTHIKGRNSTDHGSQSKALRLTSNVAFSSSGPYVETWWPLYSVPDLRATRDYMALGVRCMKRRSPLPPVIQTAVDGYHEQISIFHGVDIRVTRKISWRTACLHGNAATCVRCSRQVAYRAQSARAWPVGRRCASMMNEPKRYLKKSTLYEIRLLRQNALYNSWPICHPRNISTWNDFI